MVEQYGVHLLGGLCPREGGESGWRAAVGEPFGCPLRLGDGGQQKGGLVFVLSGLDRLETTRPRGVGNCPHVRGIELPGRPDGLMLFPTGCAEVGKAPWFGLVRRPGHRVVFFQEGYEAVQRHGQPVTTLYIGRCSGLYSSPYGIPRGNQIEDRPVYLVY